MKWSYVKNIPNKELWGIKLENNEDKPVSHSRNGQEVLAEPGGRLLALVHNYQHTTDLIEELERPPPKPVRKIFQKIHKSLVWKEVVNNHFGQVIKLMDNFGLAVGFVAWGTGGPDTWAYEPFQLLFDVFDVFVGESDCSELGKARNIVMSCRFNHRVLGMGFNFGYTNFF